MQLTILIMMWLLMLIMHFNKNKSMKTMSPFECGYNSFSPKLPMSIQFSLIVFIFLLFDIELSILISSNWNIKKIDKDWTIMVTSFIMFLMISIVYELLKKSMKWN